MTLGVFPDAAVNVRRLATAGIGLLLIGAQVAMIRPGLERICRDQWRAGAFVAVALLFFVAASVAIREGWAYRDQPEGQEVATLPSYSSITMRGFSVPRCQGPLVFTDDFGRSSGGTRETGSWAFGLQAAAALRAQAVDTPDAGPPELAMVCDMRDLPCDDGIAAPGQDFEKLCVNPATWFRAPSFEELLAEEFDPVGPAVIIGAPGERLARLGASREYLATWEWREAVTRLIEEAALIVVIIGDTENLFWELRTVVARRGWDKVVPIVPPVANKQHLQERLRRFAEGNLDLLGPVLLCADSGGMHAALHLLQASSCEPAQPEARGVALRIGYPAVDSPL